MEPHELLEALVAVVATLGELTATVAGPDGDVLLSTSPRSLHTALEKFSRHLQDTLNHGVVASLGRALADLGATPGATWANVTAKASAWRDTVATLEKSWAGVAEEATKLRDACRDTATTEAAAAATATARAGDLLKHATHWETTMDNLMALARRLPVALSKEEGASVEAAHGARVAADADEVEAATKAVGGSMVAISEAGGAIAGGKRAKEALGILERLVAACDKATAFPREMQRRLGDINLALEGTMEGSHDVPKALVAMVAEAELLWKGSASLAMRHLVKTLGDIRILLSSHPSGPGGCEVAKRCQKAIEDIPGLLKGW